jgi:hypothetical protein
VVRQSKISSTNTKFFKTGLPTKFSLGRSTENAEIFVAFFLSKICYANRALSSDTDLNFPTMTKLKLFEIKYFVPPTDFFFAELLLFFLWIVQVETNFVQKLLDADTCPQTYDPMQPICVLGYHSHVCQCICLFLSTVLPYDTCLIHVHEARTSSSDGTPAPSGSKDNTC